MERNCPQKSSLSLDRAASSSSLRRSLGHKEECKESSLKLFKIPRASFFVFVCVILTTPRPTLSFQECPVCGPENTTNPLCEDWCPDGQYYDYITGLCRNCSATCESPLQEAGRCGKRPALLCHSDDRLCCQWWEFDSFGECLLDCSKCAHGECLEGQGKCTCDHGWTGVVCDILIRSPTPETTASPTDTVHTPTTEVVQALDAWQIVLIAVGIVIGIVIFSALLVIGSFCQYTRKGRRRAANMQFHSNDTETTMMDTATILDARSNSSASVSNGHPTVMHTYVVTPPHTRAYSDLRVPV